MGNALLPLRVFWGPILLVPLGMTIGAYLFSNGLARTAVFCLMLVMTGLLVLILFGHCRPYVRLCLHAARCSSLSARGFVLHFRRCLSTKVDRERILELCESECAELGNRFCFVANKKIAIYLFQGEEEVRRVIGQPYPAFAIPQINAALLPLSSGFRNMLRHELTHLFVARLGDQLPMFKSEGIAVWIEHAGKVPRLEEADLQFLKEIEGLSGLLDRAPFLDPERRHSSYQIASNFTDFLIRRVGWCAYCKFYKDANQQTFLSTFEHAFSLTLNQAEALWLAGYGHSSPGGAKGPN